MKTYSDFVKAQILECYNLMLNYVSSEDDVGDEDSLAEMHCGIDNLSVAIPSDIYQKIDSFIKEKLDPSVYDEHYWDFSQTPDIGDFDDAGDFHTYGEKQEVQQMNLIADKINEIKKDLQSFAVKELFPLLATDTECKDESKNICQTFMNNAIMKCFLLISGFLFSDDVENEETFLKMRHDVDRYRFAIPSEVYSKICGFINATVSPLVYDEHYFDSIYTPDLGHFTENGVFQVAGDHEMRLLVGRYMLKAIEVDNELKSFGMKELYPILTA